MDMPKTFNEHLNFSGSHISQNQYQKMYDQSIKTPESFWAEQANKYLTWEKKWDQVLTGNFDKKNVRWFVGAKLNVCVNCIDRHLPTRANQPAIIWEGDSPDKSKTVTYAQLYKMILGF